MHRRHITLVALLACVPALGLSSGANSASTRQAGTSLETQGAVPVVETGVLERAADAKTTRMTATVSVKTVPFGTYADMYIETNVPTSLLVSVCRKTPAASGQCKENVPFPWVGFSLVSKTSHDVRPGPIGKLLPDTQYYYGVRAKDQNGAYTVATGSFRTQFRRVTIVFDKIRIIDDSDDLSPGDFDFAFFLGEPSDSFYTETFRFSQNGWSSGNTYPMGNKLVIDSGPTTLPLLVVARDNDVPFGALDSCGKKMKWFPPDLSAGGTCGHALDYEYGWKHFSIDVSPRPDAESFVERFLYVSVQNTGVRFTIRGRAVVVYLGR